MFLNLSVISPKAGPVSYTHLDVYKRQRQIQVFVLVPAGLTAGQLDYSYLKVQALNTPQLNATATEITTIKQFADVLLTPSQTVLIQPGQQLDLQHTLLSPVSYTHLDVYKRQALM